MGVLPVPPTVILPTTITGTGALYNLSKLSLYAIRLKAKAKRYSKDRGHNK